MPDDTTERWRPVPGWEGAYEVSDLGRIRRPIRYLTHSLASGGYRRIALYRRNKGHHYLVHQLVMAAFAGPCPEGMEIDHVDRDRANNRLANLEYVTRSTNIRRALPWRDQTAIQGERNHRAKLRADAIPVIRELHAKGMSYNELARLYGIKPAAIRAIVLRLNWKHVP